MQLSEANDRPVTSYIHRAAAYFTADRSLLPNKSYEFQLVPSANNADKTFLASSHLRVAQSLDQEVTSDRVDLVAARSEGTATTRDSRTTAVRKQYLTSDATANAQSQFGASRPRGLDQLRKAHSHNDRVYREPSSSEYYTGTAISSADQERLESVSRFHFAGSPAIAADSDKKRVNQERTSAERKPAQGDDNNKYAFRSPSLSTGVNKITQPSSLTPYQSGHREQPETANTVRMTSLTSVSRRDSQTEQLQRLLKQAREQNASLLDQKLRVERQFGQFLEESSHKFAQMNKLCDTLSALVAHYEPLVSEQQTEIARLRAQLDEESRLLAQALKERQHYETANKNVELRLDNLHQALRNERRQVVDALKRVKDNENDSRLDDQAPPCTKHSVQVQTSLDKDSSNVVPEDTPTQSHTPVSQNSAVSFETCSSTSIDVINSVPVDRQTPSDVQQKYEQALLRVRELENQVHDCNAQFRLVESSVTEIKNRHQLFLEKILFNNRRRPSMQPLTVEFSDQLDALLLPSCVSKVNFPTTLDHAHISTAPWKQLIVTNNDELDHSDDALPFADTVFTRSLHPAEFDHRKFYRLASSFSLPLPVKPALKNEHFLLRSLRATLKISDHSDRVVKMRAQRLNGTATRPASLRAYSLRSEFAKSRNTMMSLKKNSISEETSSQTKDDEDGGYDSPQTHSQILSVPDTLDNRSAVTDAADQRAILHDATQSASLSDPRPPTADKAVDCNDLGTACDLVISNRLARLDYARSSHDDVLPYSFDDWLKNDENLQVPKLLSEIERVPTYDQVAASLFRLSDAEVEERFATAASRFKLDRPTLVRRAHLCEHQHSLADNNLQKSLLETHRIVNCMLKELGDQNYIRNPFCTACDAAAKAGCNAKKSLSLLEKCITRFAARSEQLGAVQEELRTSNACEIMIGCFETLRTAHGHMIKELEDAKKQIETFENEYRIMQHKRASLSALPRTDEHVVGRRQRARRFKTLGSFNEPWVEPKSPWTNVSASLGVVNFLRALAPREREDDAEAVASFSGQDTVIDDKPAAENEESDAGTVWLKNEAVQCDEQAIIGETSKKEEEEKVATLKEAPKSSRIDFLVKLVLCLLAVVILFFLYFAFIETNMSVGGPH